LGGRGRWCRRRRGNWYRWTVVAIGVTCFGAWTLLVRSEGAGGATVGVGGWPGCAAIVIVGCLRVGEVSCENGQEEEYDHH